MIKEHYKHTISEPTPEETERWQEIKFYIYFKMILEKYRTPQHAILFAHLFCIEDQYDRKLDALAQKIINEDPRTIPTEKELIILSYKHHVSVMKIRSITHTTQQRIYNIVDAWCDEEWYHALYDEDTRRMINIFNKNVEAFSDMIKLGGNAV